LLYCDCTGWPNVKSIDNLKISMGLPVDAGVAQNFDIFEKKKKFWQTSSGLTVTIK
jgi:hypothetical protein